ncbi:MAG TPA: hypothetical protein VIL71_10715 [Spirillospora sp.]
MNGEVTGPADPWARFLDALETGCGTCGGTGSVMREQWRTWHRQADELTRVAQAARMAADMTPENAPHQPAWNGPARPGAPGQGAGGAGTSGTEPTIVAAIERAIEEHMRSRPEGPEEERCGTCHGSGRVLTPTGHRLVELLARHGFVRQG